MRFLEIAREEIAKAPLGTVGAIAGVATLIIDLWPTSGASAAATMTAKEIRLGVPELGSGLLRICLHDWKIFG